MSEKPAPLRAAFIGGSLQSAVGYAHYAATRMDGRFTIAAGCFSRNAEINAATGRDYGVPSRRVHDDWRALLKQEAKYIDTVIVLTPTPTHAEIVSECLEAGVPVICEKALATTSDEAADLLKPHHQAARLSCGDVQLFRLPDDARIARADPKRRARTHHTNPRRNAARRVRAPQWRQARRFPASLASKMAACRRLHLDLAAHLHHLVYYATGFEAAGRSALQDNFGCFDGVADNVIAAVRYEQGAAANFWFSKSALRASQRLASAHLWRARLGGMVSG